MTITSNHSAQPSNTEPSFNRTSGESSSGAHSAPWSHRGSQPSTSEDEATSFTSVRTRTKLTNPRAIWLRLVDFYFSSSFRIALRGTLGYFILSLFVFVAPMYNDTYGPLAIEMFLLIVTFGLDELHFGFISQGAIQSTTSLVMAAGLGALGAYAGETSYGITLGVAIVVTFLFTLLHADTRIAFISSMGEMFFMFNLLDSRARGYKFILQYFYDTLIGAALSHAISLFTGIVVFPCLAKSEMRRNIKKCLQLAGTALTETASFALEPRVQYTEPFIQFTSAKLTTPTSDSVNKLTSIPENSSVTLSKGNEDNGASMQQALTKKKMVDGRVIDEASSALARAKKMLNAIGYEPNLWRPFHNESIKRWRSLMDAIDEMLRTIRGLQSIVDGERRRYRAETLEQWHAMLPGLREHFATLATMCMKMSGVIDELKCGRPGDWKAYVTTKWFWLMSCFTKKDNVTIDDSETTEAKQRKVIETLQSRLFSWSTILQKFRCSVQEAYKECFEKYQSPVADEAEAPLLVGMLTMEWGPLLFVVTSSKVLQDTIGAVQDEIIYLANEETRSSWGNFARNCFGWIPICFMMFEQYWKVIRNFPLTWRAWVALIYTSEFQFCLKKWLGEVLLLIVLLISPIHVLLTKYDGTWMWMSYILYIAPSVEGTLFGGLLTITGVGIGAGISFILTYFHYPARSPYILDTYLTLATAITVFNVNNPFSLSFVTFCFSSYVIILYQYSPNAYITNWHYAVSRFVMISLGAIIAVFLNEFVLPHSALMDARENLSAALRRENTLHSWYLQSFVSGRYKENVPGEPPLSPDNQTIDDDLDSAEELVKNQEAAFEADSNNEECNGDDKVEQPKLVRPKQKANQEKKQEYIGKIQTVALDAWKGSEEGEWAYAHFRSGRRRGSSFSDARSSFEQRQRGSSRESTISEPQNCNDEQDLNQTQMNGKSEQVVESRGEKTQESVKSEHSTDGDQSRERRPESVSSVKDRKQTVAKSHKAVNNEVEVRKLLEDTATILNSIQNGVGASVHAIPKAIWTALSQERLILDRLSAFHSILEYEPILVGKFQNSGLEDFLTETTEQMKAIVIARRTLVEIMVACLMDGHPFRSFQFFREFGWKSARNTISVAWFSADFAKRVTENTASFLGANVVGSAANVLGRHTSNLVHNLTGDKLSKDKSDREKEERVGNEYSYDVNDQEASRKHREMEIFASLMALSELNHFKDTAFSGASHIKKFLQSAFTSAEKQVVEVPRSLYSWIRIAGSNVAHLAFHSQRDSQADHKSLETQNTNTSKILHETGNQNDQSTSQIEVTAEPTATLQDSTVSVEPTLSLPVDQVLDNLNALSPTTPWSFWEDLDAPSETRPDQTLPGSEERISSSRQVSYPIDSVRETVNGTEININSNSDNADSNKDKDSVSSPGARRILSGLSSRSRRTLTSPRSEKVQTISERVTEKRESAAQIRKKRNFTDIFGKLEKGLSTGVKQVGTAGGSMFHSVVHNILEGDSTEEPPVIVNLKDACKALRHAQGQLYIQYLDWVQKHQKEIIYSYGDSVSRETTNFATDPRFQNADDLLQWYALFFAAFYVLDGFQQMCRSLIDAIHEDIEVLREEHRLAVEKQVQKKKAKDLDSIRRRRRKRRKRTQNEKT
ncbi:uncharacterized protein Gasu_03380 [Galdieria sulphuraria]|uniref:Integral membrane bound transporter domain-containing protein n=1 Tax=Galdieria sulphuraria TaxID=130081 RepID=M2W9J2_GALSU|nr:uncharacterized protein Gasu_03380 [Galdieria sulphuraria]EME32566.1 hypothetical protein Gasu_03380 [Galdieria sulphuraria]|eukprot:XP_005709086.1 hypothetical protein Gasu_03380 [Galdieria sulphuraria]